MTQLINLDFAGVLSKAGFAPVRRFGRRTYRPSHFGNRRGVREFKQGLNGFKGLHFWKPTVAET